MRNFIEYKILSEVNCSKDLKVILKFVKEHYI